MTRARDVANVLTAASVLSTDTETAAAISTHAALSDPHAGYLKESEYVAAGKNKIINGDFGIWQRGISFTASGYTADRWNLSRNNTTTVSRQTFTPGTAPVSGYEGTYFLRYARTSGSSDDYLLQRVEDMRTFAGQTVTISFWAKADTATTISQVYCACNAGSGGSGAPGGVGNFNGVAITTYWERYTVTTTMASIAGSTIGTSSFVEIVFKFAAAMGNRTVDIWGVQWEVGSTATPFQTATGTIQGELAACYRYYFRYTAVGAAGNYMPFGMGHGVDANNARFMFQYPATTRGIPTLTFTAASTFQRSYGNVLTSINAGEAGRNSSSVDVTKTGEFTSNSAVLISAAANQTAYIEVSSEL